MNLGDFYIDQYLTFYVNTHNNDIAADADTVPSYRIYEEETTAPILTGNMALLDADNTNGFYSEKIQLTAANGLEYDKGYCIRILSTVNTTLIQAVCLYFKIKTEAEHKIKRSADLVLEGVVEDTDFTPTTTQFEVTGTGLADATTNAYKDMWIKVSGGNNKYEVKRITASSVVTTHVRLTVDTLSAALADGDTVMVF
jgi:hypothetical protein